MEMELRQLTTGYEREVFAKCVAEARATRGIGYRDTTRSQLGKVHLAFGGLYALFENDREPVEQMRAGFRLNDLATLPQSYPKPDVSHLPARSVLEGGELWSLSRGAGRVASRAAGAVAGMLQARAVIIHAVVKPMDLTGFYAQLNFVNAGEPVEWPFAETTDGGKLWVQPMIAEGDGLEAWIRLGFELLFQASDSRRVLRFESPISPQSVTQSMVNGRSNEATAARTAP
jgi:hypothetical protein